jgi:hypothetical protein
MSYAPERFPAPAGYYEMWGFLARANAQRIELQGGQQKAGGKNGCERSSGGLE